VKAVEAIIVLAVVGGAVVFGLSTLLRRARERRAPWRMVEDSDGEQVTVYACRPGHERLLLGSVPISAQDFDSQLYELRAEGEQKLAALNAGRRV
jgi:hypothetical protein